MLHFDLSKNAKLNALRYHLEIRLSRNYCKKQNVEGWYFEQRYCFKVLLVINLFWLMLQLLLLFNCSSLTTHSTLFSLGFALGYFVSWYGVTNPTLFCSYSA